MPGSAMATPSVRRTAPGAFSSVGLSSSPRDGSQTRISPFGPSFVRFLVLFAGWVRSGGTHAVPEALVATDVARVKDHAAFHRFFA